MLSLILITYLVVLKYLIVRHLLIFDFFIARRNIAFLCHYMACMAAIIIQSFFFIIISLGVFYDYLRFHDLFNFDTTLFLGNSRVLLIIGSYRRREWEGGVLPLVVLSHLLHDFIFNVKILGQIGKANGILWSFYHLRHELIPQLLLSQQLYQIKLEEVVEF